MVEAEVSKKLTYIKQAFKEQIKNDSANKKQFNDYLNLFRESKREGGDAT